MSGEATKLVWHAVCGVDGSCWIAEMHDDNNPPPGGSFCPDCKSRGMIAPGVLHWKPDTSNGTVDEW